MKDVDNKITGICGLAKPAPCAHPDASRIPHARAIRIRARPQRKDPVDGRARARGLAACDGSKGQQFDVIVRIHRLAASSQ